MTLPLQLSPSLCVWPPSRDRKSARCLLHGQPCADGFDASATTMLCPLAPPCSLCARLGLRYAGRSCRDRSGAGQLEASSGGGGGGRGAACEAGGGAPGASLALAARCSAAVFARGGEGGPCRRRWQSAGRRPRHGGRPLTHSHESQTCGLARGGGADARCGGLVGSARRGGWRK